MDLSTAKSELFAYAKLNGFDPTELAPPLEQSKRDLYYCGVPYRLILSRITAPFRLTIDPEMKPLPPGHDVYMLSVSTQYQGVPGLPSQQSAENIAHFFFPKGFKPVPLTIDLMHGSAKFFAVLPQE